jgi:hypothetical protein
MRAKTEGYKLLFDTGVRRENHLDANGKLIKLPNEEWHNERLHVVYYLEEIPGDDLVFEFLIQEAYYSGFMKSVQNPDQFVAIRVIGDIEEYAIFRKGG